MTLTWLDRDKSVKDVTMNIGETVKSSLDYLMLCHLLVILVAGFGLNSSIGPAVAVLDFLW